jgi:hypothetical protein
MVILGFELGLCSLYIVWNFSFSPRIQKLSPFFIPSSRENAQLNKLKRHMKALVNQLQNL